MEATETSQQVTQAALKYDLKEALCRYLGDDTFVVDQVRRRISRRAGTDETIAKVYHGVRPVGGDEPPWHVVLNQQTGHCGVYSNDWFERFTIRHWERHVLPYRRRIKRYMEIGVCEGRSMRWVMENTNCRWSHAVDPYEAPRRSKAAVFRRYEKRVRQNLEPWLSRSSRNRVRFVKEKSFEWLRGPEQPDDLTFDFIYVDGDHRGHITMMDLTLSWMKLKIGGIMAVDDLNRRWAHSQPSTWEAFSGFVLAYDHLFDFMYRTRKSAMIMKVKHI